MGSDKKDESLLRIARFLMLHGSFTNNLGLINGKMGIIIFFFHLSRYTRKKIFEDFAGEMIDEIYKEIHANMVPTYFIRKKKKSGILCRLYASSIII